MGNIYIRTWRKELSFWDDMHIVFLGIFRDACGSLVFRWWQLRLLGPYEDKDDAFRKFWLDMRVWCKRYGIKPPRGTLNSSLLFTKEAAFPELSSKYKASAVKVLAQYLAWKV